MKESQVSNIKLLTKLESENIKHSHRAIAMSKLCQGWLNKNKLLLLKDMPKLTLKQYKESINYRTNVSFIFLAGVNNVCLIDYQDQIKQGEAACCVYHATQTLTFWIGLGEFSRIVFIGILLTLIISLIFILLY